MSAPSEDGTTASGRDDRPAAARAAEEINGGSEVTRLRSRVSQLENEIERKEAEIESVRRQYEAILQGDAYDAEAGGCRDSAGLLDRLR
jgi:predicted RNase H-like nuclease (RuvC/YqgF family)